MNGQPDAFDTNNLPAPRAFHCTLCGANVVAACFCPQTTSPKSTTRTDPHREGAIIPSDYTPVLSFGHFSQGFGFHIDCVREFASYQVNPDGSISGVHQGKHSSDPAFVCCLARARALALTMWQHPARNSSSTNCDICGAYFMHGAIWRHTPSGEHIFLGHDCEDKYGMTMDRTAWLAWHTNQTRLRGIAAKTKKYKVAALRFLEKNPQLAEAMALGENPHQPGEFWGLRVLRDILSKLNTYGSISDATVAYALKLSGEARTFVATPAPPPEPHVEAPEGRVTFKGTVISTKAVDTPIGYGLPRTTIKMIVKVQEPLGFWFCYVTAPDVILGSDIKGKQVQLTATLTRSDKDYFFAFGKRPSGARIL